MFWMVGDMVGCLLWRTYIGGHHRLVVAAIVLCDFMRLLVYGIFFGEDGIRIIVGLGGGRLYDRMTRNDVVTFITIPFGRP